MTTTNLTTRNILSVLIQSRCFVWRNNTTGIYDTQKKVFRTNKIALKGVADIIGITQRGQFIAIEIKTGKYEKLNPNQEYFKEQIINHGGIYMMVRDTDDFIKQFDGLTKL